MAPDSSDYVADFSLEVDLDPATTCLLLVDFQNALGNRELGLGRLLARQGRASEAEYRYRRIEKTAVPNAARLLGAFRERGLERLFLTVGSERADWSDLGGPLRELCRAVNSRVGESEHEILHALRPQDGEEVLNKTSFSPFASTHVDELLRERGVGTLVLAGLTTNMCVEHTLRDAVDRGYACVLAEDACATDSVEMHEGTLRNVARLYGAVAATGELIAALGAAPAPAGSR